MSVDLFVVGIFSLWFLVGTIVDYWSSGSCSREQWWPIPAFAFCFFMMSVNGFSLYHLEASMVAGLLVFGRAMAYFWYAGSLRPIRTRCLAQKQEGWAYRLINLDVEIIRLQTELAEFRGLSASSIQHRGYLQLERQLARAEKKREKLKGKLNFFEA